MRTSPVLLASLFLLGLLGLAAPAGPSRAQEGPVEKQKDGGGDRRVEAIVTPAKIVLSAVRGTTEVRKILLRTSGKEPLTGLRFVPQDVPQEGGSTVLPASTITATIDKGQVTANEPLSVPITFRFRDAPSGEFSGELLFLYQEGSIKVPVKATVKAPGHWPLLVTFVGVFLGLAISRYRGRGKLRDEVHIRMSEVAAQLQADKDLHPAFRARIEDRMAATQIALQGERWEAAQQALTQTEEIFNRWRSGRSDWLEHLGYGKRLAEAQQQWDQGASYIQAVQRGLDDAVRAAPTLDGPDKLRDRLVLLSEQINRYQRISGIWDEINGLRDRLKPDENDRWRLDLQDLRRELNEQRPDDTKSLDEVQDKFKKKREELVALLAQRAGAGERAGGARDLTGPGAGAVPPAPALTSPALSPADRWATWRLTVFWAITYLASLFFLTMLGFSQLYLERPTFGANPWSEYLALFGWGMGAEATLSSVTQVLRGWGVQTPRGAEGK